MAEEQLKLFKLRSVLQERFDRGFFRSLPRETGVYLMRDAADRVIYVGKAKDLRQRISSYRYAAEGSSRKTARMVARVATIRWQICVSEEAALLEENRLLRALRPRFNRMNTWPKTSRFIRVTVGVSHVQLGLVSEPEGECYGAFKGASRANFGALLRLLYAMNGSYSLLPRRLLVERTPTHAEFSIHSSEAWLANLRSFLRGESDALLKPPATGNADESVFDIAFRQSDVATAEHFFRIGPLRNKTLREHFNPPHLIAPHELDDLIVRHRKTQRPGGSANATYASPAGVPSLPPPVAAITTNCLPLTS